LAEGELVNEATGQHTVLYEMRNGSSRPCTLNGYPQITIFDGKGEPVPFIYAGHGDQMITNSKPHLVVVEPAGVAYFGVNKYRCDRGDVTEPVRIDIRLVNGARFVAAINDMRSFAYCGPDDPGDAVSISPLEQTQVAVFSG
jgi:hypothetical protein